VDVHAHKLERRWTFVSGALVLAYLGCAVFAAPGYRLTAFGDLAQCALLLGVTASFALNLQARRRKSRLFWSMMTLGGGMWLASQLVWTWYEVFLRKEAPNPFAGDVVLFLHLVPMIGALALQPQARQESHSARLGAVDFSLLFTWWLYLYCFIVIPWQYVSPAEAIYGRSFDVLYSCEQLVFAGGLGILWARSGGSWRGIYRQLFAAALLYGVGSIIASEAIDRHTYYTGCLYDVPLVAGMALFSRIGLTARATAEEKPEPHIKSDGAAIWTARLAMLAVCSLAFFVASTELDTTVPSSVRSYRLFLTAAVALAMGALVYLKQHLLDRDLLALLRMSRSNLEEMRQLKDELERKEQALRWQSIELQHKNLELQEISYTDALTGLWNRRYLEEILTAEAAQVRRSYERAREEDPTAAAHRDLVFLLVDMDFFKEVNDTHGHAAGDKLLQLVAKRLGRIVRKSDILVRWGGEEFVIMVRAASPDEIPTFCERILRVMSDELFNLGSGISVHKTCSVGWAPYPWRRDAIDALCAEEVIEIADTALYRAKAMGRNRSVGIVPNSTSAAPPSSITLKAIQEQTSGIARLLHNEGPSDQPAPAALPTLMVDRD
jgi:diguanylate cyclase (GGDEF)-like protein